MTADMSVPVTVGVLVMRMNVCFWEKVTNAHGDPNCKGIFRYYRNAFGIAFKSPAPLSPPLLSPPWAAAWEALTFGRDGKCGQGELPAPGAPPHPPLNEPNLDRGSL